MSAFLFIQRRRESAERIDFVGMIRTATNGSKQHVEAAMMKWARDAEVDLTFED